MVTKMATFAGISTDHEEAGNFVYRFSKKEFEKWTKEKGYTKLLAKRYLMFYPHFPPEWFKMFENIFLLNVFKLCFELMNNLIGFIGNKILFIVIK
jgi:hypothetical protein